MNSTEIFGARPADSQSADSVRASLEELEAATLLHLRHTLRRVRHHRQRGAPQERGDELPRPGAMRQPGEQPGGQAATLLPDHPQCLKKP